MLTPLDLKHSLDTLRLDPRQAARFFGLGRNGERSIRRMLKAEKPIPAGYEKPLRDALCGSWPKHFTAPTLSRPDDPRPIARALIGGA